MGVLKRIDLRMDLQSEMIQRKIGIFRNKRTGYYVFFKSNKSNIENFEPVTIIDFIAICEKLKLAVYNIDGYLRINKEV